jgi:hypothetical protein
MILILILYSTHHWFKDQILCVLYVHFWPIQSAWLLNMLPLFSTHILNPELTQLYKRGLRNMACLLKTHCWCHMYMGHEIGWDFMCFKLLEKTWHAFAKNIAENRGTWMAFSLDMEALGEGVGFDDWAALYRTVCDSVMPCTSPPLFSRNLLPQHSACLAYPSTLSLLFCLLSDSKDGGSMSIQNAIQLMWLVIGFTLWWPEFDPRSGHVGCGGQIGTGAAFLRVLWFLSPILIPPNTPY